MTRKATKSRKSQKAKAKPRARVRRGEPEVVVEVYAHQEGGLYLTECSEELAALSHARGFTPGYFGCEGPVRKLFRGDSNPIPRGQRLLLTFRRLDGITRKAVGFWSWRVVGAMFNMAPASDQVLTRLGVKDGEPVAYRVTISPRNTVTR